MKKLLVNIWCTLGVIILLPLLLTAIGVTLLFYGKELAGSLLNGIYDGIT